MEANALWFVGFLQALICLILMDIRGKVSEVGKKFDSHIQDHLERKFCNPHVEMVGYNQAGRAVNFPLAPAK